MFVYRPAAPRRPAPRQHALRVRGLRQAHPRQVPAERAGPALARGVRPLLRLSPHALRQVLQPRGEALLQERLLQVGPHPPEITAIPVYNFVTGTTN